MADILIETQTTNADGVAAFANLPDGQYKYVQKAAPTGYTLDSAEYTISVSGGTVTVTRTNAPTATGSLQVHKSDLLTPATNIPGATFTLTRNGKTMLTESTATDADGNLTFPNLMSISGSPQDYSVKEVTVPEGYKPNGNTYTTAVVQGATPTNQEIGDLPFGSNTLDVSLKDVNYQLFGLQGSDYELYYTTGA